MVIGNETAIALGEVADKYEGSLKETDAGIEIEFHDRQGNHSECFIHETEIPKDNPMRDIYIAYRVRKAGRLLDKQRMKGELFA